MSFSKSNAYKERTHACGKRFLKERIRKITLQDIQKGGYKTNNRSKIKNTAHYQVF
jgi:hypothetical protein